MSLTSHVRDRNSAIYQFLHEQFPHARSIVQARRGELAGVSTIRPGMKVPYSTIGTAFDYRLRYYFAVTACNELVAWDGAAACTAFNLEGLTSQFFASLENALLNLRPVVRRLDRQDEELLLRHCVVLALFEEVYRAGMQKGSPLFAPEPKRTLPELLAVAKEHWIDDLRQLSWAFYDHFGHLTSQPTILNPTFEGSEDVGGADADLIVDGCLLDIKATVNPRIDPDWLCQILGYVLLDYNDQYRIDKVGIYLARQQLMLTWGISDLIPAMMGNDTKTLPQLRRQFQRVARRQRAPVARLRQQLNRLLFMLRKQK